MKHNKSLILMLFYLIALLLILVFCVAFLYDTEETPTDSTVGVEYESVIITEQVFIEVTKENMNVYLPETTEVKELNYTVKEYEGKIGIFDDKGELIYVIDVYVKTLPEADRRMLGEGIDINSISELRDIIEDYSD